VTAPGVPALRVRDLVKRHRDPEGGEREVLRVPALDVAAGEEVAVSGESGSGKTTLLHVVAGILPADEGVVEIAGERMAGSEAARDRLRARRIGYVFQTFNLLSAMTALENVALGMAFRPREGGDAPAALARAALVRVGLGERLHHRPSMLSVGQQQRVAIARALAGRPSLVLADEPTSNLDRRSGDDCLALLREFARERGAALVVVTHDPRVLERFPRRVAIEVPREEAGTSPPARGAS
jgi:putative ABC transport system ATP-binding protein